MKTHITTKRVNGKILVRTSLLLLVTVTVSYSLLSFTTKTIKDEFLNIIGITRTEANERIAGSMIGGYLNTYGVNKIKNLAAADRVVVAKDLLAYTKNYVTSEDFRKHYAQLKQENKPQFNGAPETPEKYRAKIIAQAKEAVKQAEDIIAKATPENKALFQPALDAAKQNLKEMEDPANEFLKMYADNYESLSKMYIEDSVGRIKTWHEEYPDNPKSFIKTRLEEFMAATDHVDFAAQLKEEHGKKYFVNPAYESKDSHWKMAYRAGKEVVEASRSFVKQWLSEMN
ncbi:hypothetical protein I5907_11580 [Panacibacter sp. DH6]|uniref:DUF3829 domain-containing protein n=1 Tax=Panacibacter microcysteis TaxID=2793269 RepID=A0A931E7M8_9BACT|nr:hypothetical protein [Panacibacter microcysteis]MBG9376881.1 hypothetical protein [Panacibacter microcysteis]